MNDQNLVEPCECESLMHGSAGGKAVTPTYPVCATSTGPQSQKKKKIVIGPW